MKPHVLKREFHLGQLVLEDPNPDWSPKEVLDSYAPTFPLLSQCRVGEPEVRDGVLVFPIERPAVTTKGAPNPSVRERLKQWAATAKTTHEDIASHFDRLQEVHRVVTRRLHEDRQGSHGRVPIDPWNIALP